MFKKTLTKEDLINSISLKSGLSKNYSKKFTNDFINIVIQNLKNGNFHLLNIGKFKTIRKNERLGRNPKTKEEFIISSRNSISFTASKKILENLKNYYE